MIRIHCEGVEHVFPTLPVTLGRDPDNDLPLADVKLSRHHCRILRTPEGFLLEDLESRNGTFVNGIQIRRHLLSLGDAVMIGVTSLSIEWDPESAGPIRPRKRTLQDLQELEHENDRLRQLLSIAKSVASETNEEALLRRIVDSAMELTQAKQGFLFTVTLHGLDFRVARDSEGHDIEQPAAKVSSSIARRAMESGRAVVTEDAGGDSRFEGYRSIAFLKLRSVLCVPLKVPDGPLGALYLENNALSSNFRPQDVPIVAAFADFAAIALAGALHVAELRRNEEQLRQSRERIGKLNLRLKSLLRQQSEELAGVRADLDMSRRELGLRYDYTTIVGHSEAMRNTLALLDRVMESSVPVLLVGETGTGKDLLARALHYNGPRRSGPFITVNCAALPAGLLEADLFGCESGAYTGAEGPRQGLFEQADNGTLFLDEVSEVPLDLQAKFLRVLESGEVRRLGSEQVRKVSVRTVAASNKDLSELARANTFREDLYYRLNGVTIRVPPLRERAEDIPALVDHFLDAICAEQEIDRPPVEPEVLDRLQAYPWPGNVRELHNEVQRLLALQRGKISPEQLSLHVYSGDPAAVPPAHLPPGGLRELVEDLEKRLLLDTLQRLEGNKTRAAALLGLSRLGLRKKLERYGLNDKV